ncbi:hypothetical protein AB6A40_006431 [Gnathostoma spinigerum]|uniref:Uncharacterized protein n=1 Tax=Gnathostoma spinigerum TaxID=75299 RepID=A0ABD6EKJ4_9BILA
MYATYEIKETWDGHTVEHSPISVRLEGCTSGGVLSSGHHIKTIVDAPFFNDPPPAIPPGICPKLWDHEVFEVFFANEKNQYLEVEVGPHGHWLCLMHDGIRNAFNKGENLKLEVSATIKNSKWHAEFKIPLAYMPPAVKSFNMYAIHGSAENRIYEALNKVTDGTYSFPDYHRLQFFKPIDITLFIPENLSSIPYDDPVLGNFWKGH